MHFDHLGAVQTIDSNILETQMSSLIIRWIRWNCNLPRAKKTEKNNDDAAQSIVPLNVQGSLTHTFLILLMRLGEIGSPLILLEFLHCTDLMPLSTCSSLAILLIWGSPKPSATCMFLIAERYDLIVLWHKFWSANEDINKQSWVSDAGRGASPLLLQNVIYRFIAELYVFCVDARPCWK